MEDVLDDMGVFNVVNFVRKVRGSIWGYSDYWVELFEGWGDGDGVWGWLGGLEGIVYMRVWWGDGVWYS